MSERPFSLRPTDAVSGVNAYSVPRTQAPLDLILDGNEGIPPPAWLFDVLKDHGPELLRRYPRTLDVAALLAARLGLPADHILVTAGGDDALDRICRAFIGHGRRLIYPAPSFDMLRRYALISGAQVVRVPWLPDQPLPAAAIEEAITEDTAAIAVVTPNNPTGAVADTDALIGLARAYPEILLIVDLAYIEFADEDPTPSLIEWPNIVMVRTLSKAWGLAGLRVGYALGCPELIRWLRTAGAPYPISAPSLALAQARLERQDPGPAKFVARVREERTRLTEGIRAVGGQPASSQANFIFARFPDAVWLRNGMAGLGIAVRLFPQQDHLENAVRITCPGNEADLERVLAGLKTVLAPQALIFDMDGVLVDVSKSYRAAITATAATYDVAVSAEDIRAAKAAGGANNDWELTRALLAKSGVDASLAEVTERFEAIYQGTEEEPGLRASETPLMDASVLGRLAARLPLAIVTGRPRADARRFLDSSGFGPYFKVVICMEDAPGKPDPAPVRLALSRLGVAHAWMLGDTVDDVTAARRAAVVPIGVLAPGETAEVTGQTLLRAGAACVLDQAADLEERLP